MDDTKQLKEFAFGDVVDVYVPDAQEGDEWRTVKYVDKETVKAISLKLPEFELLVDEEPEFMPEETLARVSWLVEGIELEE